MVIIVRNLVIIVRNIIIIVKNMMIMVRNIIIMVRNTIIMVRNIMIMIRNIMIRNQVLIYNLLGLIIVVSYTLFTEKSRNKVLTLFFMIGVLYYSVILWHILVVLAECFYLVVEKIIQIIIPGFNISKTFIIINNVLFILLYIWVFISLILELIKLCKHLKDRLFFENRDPRSLGLKELGLSERVQFVLINEGGIYSLNNLIVTVLVTPESIHEIEGLDDQAKNQIFLKISDFVTTSYTLSALFYSNHAKLKVKPWWYILFVIVTRKDPQFRFITELWLSPRVTTLLVHRGIYMIKELLTLVSNTQGCQYLLDYIEDFQYEDFLEIFQKLESWYGMVGKRKRPVFKFITQLDLSERLSVLLMYEDLYTIDRLKKTIRKPKSCKALLEIEDFSDEDFVEIFQKVEWWYRLVRKRKDSVFQFITELGLSPRVTVLLLHQGIDTVGRLKETVTEVLSRRALLKRKDFSAADFVEIFQKVEWWYRLVRKRKDSVFQFITELGLSPRVTVLLLYQGIDTVGELRRTIKDVISRRALLEIEDFSDEDFVDIFKKVEWWYRLVRKRKDSVFQFITELDLSPRVTVLLLGKGLSRIDQLRLTVKDPEAREALLQMEDFENEHLLEIFKKVDWC